jgi:chromosome segregation ATPase
MAFLLRAAGTLAARDLATASQDAHTLGLLWMALGILIGFAFVAFVTSARGRLFGDPDVLLDLERHEVQLLEANLRTANANLDTANGGLAQRNLDIRHLETNLRAANADIAQRNGVIADRDDKIRRLEEDLGQNAVQNTQHLNRIRVLERECQDARDAAQRADANLAQRNRVTAERDREIQRLRGRVNDLGRLAPLEGQVARLQRDLGESRLGQQHLRAERDARRRELDQAQAELNTLQERCAFLQQQYAFLQQHQNGRSAGATGSHAAVA